MFVCCNDKVAQILRERYLDGQSVSWDNKEENGEREEGSSKQNDSLFGMLQATALILLTLGVTIIVYPTPNPRHINNFNIN